MGAVDLYIQSIDGPQQEIVIELRRIISRISADFKEEMKWNVPTFSIKRNICSIIPHKNHVNLQFFQGAEIQDSDSLLGSGKGMRHLRYEKLSDIDHDVVKKLIQQAIMVDCT